MSAINLFDISADVQNIASWTKDGSGTSISSTSNALHVLFQNTSLAVTATDLDIRDLVFATDKVDVSGSTVELGATTLAALESITVVATDLDIRNLVFATDKVDVSGSTVTTSEDPHDTISSDSLTVGTSAVLLVAASPVANRRRIIVQNNSSNSIYLGGSAVTTSIGILVPKNGNIELTASAALYAIAGQAGNNVRILELGLG